MQDCRRIIPSEFGLLCSLSIIVELSGGVVGGAKALLLERRAAGVQALADNGRAGGLRLRERDVLILLLRVANLVLFGSRLQS